MLSLNEIKLLEDIFKTISNVEVSIQGIYKGGIQKTAIIFNTDRNMRPCVYAEDYEYTDLMDLARQALVSIADIKQMFETEPTVKNLSNWEWAKYRLQLCVSPKTEEENLVKRDYLDLQEYVRVIVDTGENNLASAKVTPQLLKEWGVTENTLFAFAQAGCIQNAVIGSVVQALYGQEPLPLAYFEKQNESEMLMVTNSQSINGAGIIGCKSAIANIAEKLESDLYILPSSIHEILLVPVLSVTREGLEEMTNMVTGVNTTEVLPEEVLSDHAYAYSRATGEIFW